MANSNSFNRSDPPNNITNANVITLDSVGDAGGISVNEIPKYFYRFYKLWAKMFRLYHGYATDADRINIMLIGDSTGAQLFGQGRVIEYICRACGINFAEKCVGQLGLSGSATINSIVYPSVSKTMSQAGQYTTYDYSNDCTRWPNGGGLGLDSSGDYIELTYGGGFTPLASEIDLFFSNKSAGTFDVSIQVSGGSYVKHNVSPVEVYATGDILRYNIPSLDTTKGYKIKIEWLSGDVRFHQMSLKTLPGTMNVFNIGAGGLALCGATGLMQFYDGGFADITENMAGTFDLIVVQDFGTMTQYGHETLGFPQLIDRIQAAWPGVDIVVVGAVNTTGDGDGFPLETNELMRATCLAKGCMYYDQMSLLPSQAFLTAMGWHGDGVHMAQDAIAYSAAGLIKAMGLLDLPWVNSPKNVLNAITSTDALKFPNNTSVSLQVEPTSKLDVELRPNRNFNLKDNAGNITASLSAASGDSEFKRKFIFSGIADRAYNSSGTIGGFYVSNTGNIMFCVAANAWIRITPGGVIQTTW